MRSTARVVIVAGVLFAGVLAWGYWHSATHASLAMDIEDYGLATARQLYASPHHVSVVFFDAARQPLAAAKSVEPAGYLLAAHPDPKVADCSQYQNARVEYAKCFPVHSTWVAQWASRARTATVTVGACTLRDLPVRVHSSTGEWLVWWVPLPHVGGVPYRYYSLSVKLNSKTCSQVKP